MTKSNKCSICNSNPQLQGGLVYIEDKPETLELVCGLHPSEDGKKLKEGEAAGNWLVFTSWGYLPPGVGLAVVGTPENYALTLFDQVLERVQNTSDPDWGWKVVVTLGPIALEASTFPKDRRNNYKPSPKPESKTPSAPVTLSNESIFNGMDWKTKYQNNTVEARIDSAWAWAFRADKDGSQNDVQIALQTAIEKADKNGAEIDGFIYTIGGRDGNLVNRKITGAK